MKEKLKKFSEFVSKKNVKLSSHKIKLEERLKKFQGHLAASLKKNADLEKDLVYVREELNKSLKWSSSSQILANLTNQRSKNSNGLGYQNINFSYNPNNKYLPMSNKLLSTHY